MKIVFWVSAFLIVYNLVIAPGVVIILSYLFGRPVRKDKDYLPSVTVLITAHNEEKHIRQKIENSLALEYPADRLQILVALDGCTDRTEEIVREFDDPRVEVLAFPEQRGKTAVQDDGVEAVRGEIIFFTDATAYHNPEAVRELVANCADPDVACATGWHGFTDPSGAGASGVGARLGYELYLRQRQGILYSMHGAAGCNMAMPREYVARVGKGLNHDWAAPILALCQGKRTVFEPGAKAFLKRPLSDEDELQRRTRIVAQGMRGIFEIPESLNPIRHPILSFSIVSLRLLKWLIPVLLISLLASNFFLLDEAFYQVTLALQIIFYGLAALGFFLRDIVPVPRVISIPFYFCLLNVAALRGLWRFIRGDKQVTWQATSR